MIFIERKNGKIIYYVVELENLHSFRKATIVSAKSLRGAKSWASRNQCFCNTVIVVGQSVDNNGFIDMDMPYSYRYPDKKGDNAWHDVD